MTGPRSIEAIGLPLADSFGLRVHLNSPCLMVIQTEPFTVVSLKSCASLVRNPSFESSGILA